MMNREIQKKQATDQKPMNLPWAYASYGGGEGVVEDCYGDVVMKNQAFREVCPEPLRMYEITRACNSHAQLVAALRDALALMLDNGLDECDQYEKGKELLATVSGLGEKP